MENELDFGGGDGGAIEMVIIGGAAVVIAAASFVVGRVFSNRELKAANAALLQRFELLELRVPPAQAAVQQVPAQAAVQQVPAQVAGQIPG